MMQKFLEAELKRAILAAEAEQLKKEHEFSFRPGGAKQIIQLITDAQ
jgi:hypothetical protein